MLWKTLIGAVIALSFAQTANAQMVVLGNGAAKDCYYSVKHGDPGRAHTIKSCEGALDELALKVKDRAATHVNVGILYMRRKNYDKAQYHYNRALSMGPDIPEVHINLSAKHIYTGDYTAALDSVNYAIELGTEKMPEALFNRAMAYDHLEKYDLAYRDLKKALQLRPDWQPALNALDNYEVVSKPKGS